MPPQSLSELACFFFAVFGRRNIRAASVLVGQRPRGLAVANEVKVERHRGFNRFTLSETMGMMSYPPTNR